MSIFVTQSTTDELRAFMEEMEWTEVAEAAGELVWRAPAPPALQAMDAVVRWWPLDDDWGALVFEGEDAMVASGDFGGVFELLDDVDLMNAIAETDDPAEVIHWGRLLGVFAADDQVQSAVVDVLRGLLTSGRLDFATAAVRGLVRARWSELTEALSATKATWPELADGCERALAAIRSNPV